jgi:hypothetical protein
MGFQWMVHWLVLGHTIHYMEGVDAKQWWPNFLFIQSFYINTHTQ